MAHTPDSSACLLLHAGDPRVVPEGAFAVASRPTIDLFECPVCSGSAHVSSYDENGYRVLRPCPGSSMDRRIELFNAARIPARYSDATMASFQPQHRVLPRSVDKRRRALDAFEPGHKGVLFSGPVGTGKTHLLAAMLQHLTLKKGVGVRYIEFTHLLSEIRHGYNEGRSETELLRPLAEVPVLAIDELGKGRLTPFALDVIDELVSHRYNNSSSCTTLFASNYLPTGGAARREGGELAERLSDRISERVESRIFEMCDFIYLQGDDYRQRQQR